MDQFRPGGFRILPPVVKNLIIINGLFFLATIATGSRFGFDLVDTLGLHYFAADKFEPYQFITYMFMHGGFMHIFFNMFALWMFGNALENVWGPKRFLIYYIITGIGAALTHYLVFYFQISPVLSAINGFLDDPSHEALNKILNSDYFKIASVEIQNHYNAFRIEYNNIIHSNPTKALQLSIDFMSQYKIDFLNAPVVIGASGAVFGILLAFGMMFPNALIYVYFAIPVKAKYFVMIYGAIELFSGIADTGSNVAHFAHLGGMVFGYFILLYWKRR
ncbi:MAG: rhomboid family intramembrane serine protease [Bacteroidales bacterium]|nr:rhomboid family intramembrane serine protease [Bacteroidales bacterium]